MANTLLLRRRIRSIKNTRQITKAMELVAATKMRRAQIQALRGRTYSLLAWDMLNSLAGKVDPEQHILLRKPDEVKQITLVAITSNRGLAGNFNANVVAAAREFIRSKAADNADVKVEIVAVGTKGSREFAKAGVDVIAEFEKSDLNTRVEDVLPISAFVTKRFAEFKTDLVVCAYTDFVSTLKQYPRVKQILPFPKLISAEELALRDDLGKVILEDRKSPNTEYQQQREVGYGYTFEPSPNLIFAKLLPRIIEMQLYQASLEANASEHSARMIAMKNASDAANDLISEYTLQFNQIRQAAITREIAEISAGRMAVT